MSSPFTVPPAELAVANEIVQLQLQEVGATVATSAKLDVFEDPVRLLRDVHGQLVHRLKAFLLTQQLVSDTYSKDYYVPASWWQHFKADYHGRWWLRWFVNRRPVELRRETVTVKFERYATYPNASIAIRDDRLGAPILMERVSEQ